MIIARRSLSKIKKGYRSVSGVKERFVVQNSNNTKNIPTHNGWKSYIKGEKYRIELEFYRIWATRFPPLSLAFSISLIASSTVSSIDFEGGLSKNPALSVILTAPSSALKLDS